MKISTFTKDEKQKKRISEKYTLFKKLFNAVHQFFDDRI